LPVPSVSEDFCGGWNTPLRPDLALPIARDKLVAPPGSALDGFDLRFAFEDRCHTQIGAIWP